MSYGAPLDHEDRTPTSRASRATKVQVARKTGAVHLVPKRGSNQTVASPFRCPFGENTIVGYPLLGGYHGSSKDPFGLLGASVFGGHLAWKLCSESMKVHAPTEANRSGSNQASCTMPTGTHGPSRDPILLAEARVRCAPVQSVETEDSVPNKNPLGSLELIDSILHKESGRFKSALNRGFMPFHKLGTERPLLRFKRTCTSG